MVQQFKFKANRPRVVGDTNIKPYWKVIHEIIEESDLILEVLDARMPDLSRNLELEEAIKKSKKQLIFILNKADLTSKDIVIKNKRKLSKKAECFVISSKDKVSVSKLRGYLLAIGSKKEFMKIGVLGYPNTGKSSLINSLVRRKKAPVSSKAGTTHGQQWISMKENIRIIDSPGIIPLKQDDELRYALIGSRNPEKIKNLDLVAQEIIKLFDNLENIEKLYKIKIENIEAGEIIEEIGRKKGFLKKGNEVDDSRVAIQIIRDWQQGKLRL